MNAACGRVHTQAIRAAPGPAGQPRSQQCTATLPTALGVIAPDVFPLWGLTEVWFSLVNNRELSKQRSSLKKGRNSLAIIPICLTWKKFRSSPITSERKYLNSSSTIKKHQRFVVEKTPTTIQSKVSHKKISVVWDGFWKKNNYIDRL